jgi:hypothetical protein
MHSAAHPNNARRNVSSVQDLLVLHVSTMPRPTTGMRPNIAAPRARMHHQTDSM